MSTDIQKIDDAIAELDPAYRVDRNEFTYADDFRRWKKRFPEQVEPTLELIRQQQKAREGKGITQ